MQPLGVFHEHDRSFGIACFLELGLDNVIRAPGHVADQIKIDELIREAKVSTHAATFSQIAILTKPSGLGIVGVGPAKWTQLELPATASPTVVPSDQKV